MEHLGAHNSCSENVLTQMGKLGKFCLLCPLQFAPPKERTSFCLGDEGETDSL